MNNCFVVIKVIKDVVLFLFLLELIFIKVSGLATLSFPPVKFDRIPRLPIIKGAAGFCTLRVLFSAF
jgi:hypothetical protein